MTRIRTRNEKTEIVLETDHENLSKPTTKATQEEINRILGMNYDVFVNSCCIQQGESDSFSKLTPSQAAQLLSSVLQLDFYSNCKIKAVDKCCTAKVSADKLEQACGYLKEKIEEQEKVQSLIKEKQDTLKTSEGTYSH